MTHTKVSNGQKHISVNSVSGFWSAWLFSDVCSFKLGQIFKSHSFLVSSFLSNKKVHAIRLKIANMAIAGIFLLIMS